MITRIFKHELHELNKSFESDRDHTPSPLERVGVR